MIIWINAVLYSEIIHMMLTQDKDTLLRFWKILSVIRHTDNRIQISLTKSEFWLMQENEALK